jgi:hypothetical protein
VAELKDIERHDYEQTGNQAGNQAGRRQGQDLSTKDEEDLSPISRSNVQIHQGYTEHRSPQALSSANR